jgi:hypothetical protein
MVHTLFPLINYPLHSINIIYKAVLKILFIIELVKRLYKILHIFRFFFEALVMPHYQENKS